ncbi:MAG: methyltransferase domain-containing protein, partial [Planctomycetota bacterium]
MTVRDLAFHVSVVAAALLLAPRCRSAGAAEAERIYAETGVTGGLVVHLGCGDGRLTAGLLCDGALVFGLDADPANVARARTHLLAAGVNGRATADLLRGGRIPLVDGTASLVVSDAPGLVPM